jgi:DNA-binding NarL/FixJ family response regulator
MTNSEEGRPFIGVFVAEATPMGCELMATALRHSAYRFNVIGSAIDSSDFPACIDESAKKVDVAVISAGLRDGPIAGFAFARKLRACWPAAAIVALLDSSERDVVVEAFRSGATGLLSREQPFENICKCIDAVHRGQVWVTSKEMKFGLAALVQSERLTAQVRRETNGENALTMREEEVVQLVCEGCTNREIAKKLQLSANTVRNYLFRIFNKVGSSNRLELAMYALNRKKYRTQMEEEPDNITSYASLDSAA